MFSFETASPSSTTTVTPTGWGSNTSTPAHSTPSLSTSSSSNIRNLIQSVDGEEYGQEASQVLTKMLKKLDTIGYKRALVKDLSIFDRILGGICWLLQRIVQREQADRGRVQWDLLFQSHARMKPRLGLAQEVIKRIELLPFAYPTPIQPHQLLLQDFADIGAIHKFLLWLMEQHENLSIHLETYCTNRAHVKLQQQEEQEVRKRILPNIQQMDKKYMPKRQYQYAQQQPHEETEDALIQRCLLEYGEHVATSLLTNSNSVIMNESVPSAPSAHNNSPQDPQIIDPQKNFVADISAQALKLSQRGSSLNQLKKKKLTEFDVQYQQAEKKAWEEQQQLIALQKEREIQFLQNLSVVQDEKEEEEVNTKLQQLSILDDNIIKNNVQLAEVAYENTLRCLLSNTEQAKMLLQQDLVFKQKLLQEKEEEKKKLLLKQKELTEQHTMYIQAIEEMKKEQEQLCLKEQHAKITLGEETFHHLEQLVNENEKLQKEKNTLKNNFFQQANILQSRLDQVKQQEEQITKEEQKLKVIYQEMKLKWKEKKKLLSKELQWIHFKKRFLDEIPSRIELIQYEKRFMELYQEVTMTLDETRKYFSIYNTLKKKHEFMEKEISLMNSIVENFTLAMSSTKATQMFFQQIEDILHQVKEILLKQKQIRLDKQQIIENLEKKHHSLIDKERMFVTHIQEFQKECEKNEKLQKKIRQLQK